MLSVERTYIKGEALTSIRKYVFVPSQWLFNSIHIREAFVDSFQLPIASSGGTASNAECI